MKAFVVSLLVALLLAPCSDAARQINWQSASGATDQQSDGRALTGDFQFAIGRFVASDGSAFIPTSANLSEWTANWQEFATTSYDSERSRIRGTAILPDNNAFPVGAPLYLWAYNTQTGPDPEWFLARDPSWAWPDADEPLAFAYTITVSDLESDDIILGRVDIPEVQLQTAPGFIPILTFAEWQDLQFTPAQLSDPASSGPQSDPDQDGLVNLFEYAYGTPPLRSNASPVAITAMSPNRVRISVARSAQANLVWQLLTSPDLAPASFQPVPLPAATPVTDTPSVLVYEVDRSVASQFFQVAISLP